MTGILNGGANSACVSGTTMSKEALSNHDDMRQPVSCHHVSPQTVLMCTEHMHGTLPLWLSEDTTSLQLF